jgi:hypothetical protein
MHKPTDIPALSQEDFDQLEERKARARALRSSS